MGHFFPASQRYDDAEEDGQPGGLRWRYRPAIVASPVEKYHARFGDASPAFLGDNGPSYFSFRDGNRRQHRTYVRLLCGFKRALPNGLLGPPPHRLDTGEGAGGAN